MDEKQDPPTRGQQVVPSASEHPLWRSENLAVVLTEGALSVYPHEGGQVPRFITFRSQKWEGSEPGKSSLPSWVTSRTYRVVGVEVTNYLQAQI